MAETKLMRIDNFKAVLNDAQIRAQIRNSLHENAGAFMSSMIDLYSSDKTLQDCDPRAVALECLKAASLKLPIVKSLGFAYVVPFKNVPTFVIGYKGLIQLAMRTGMFKTINASEVYEGEISHTDKLSGMIDFNGEKSGEKVVGYFAYFKLLNGYEKMFYMTKEAVVAYAKRYSPSYNSKYTPWATEFDKMAIKTVLRQLLGTYGPMSTEFQEAFLKDDSGSTPQQDAEHNANKKPLETSFQELSPDAAETPGTDQKTDPAPTKTEPPEPTAEF